MRMAAIVHMLAGHLSAFSCLLVGVLLILTDTRAWAQPSALAGDSIPVLRQADFLQRVVDYHPLVRQAVLYRRLAQAQIREARGSFDPKLALGLDGKRLDGTSYYTTNTQKLTLPTRAGLDLVAGREYATGTFVNPEEDTKGSGLLFGGIQLSVGQGLFIDARRAGLQQARNQTPIAEATVAQYANKMLSEANKAYWEWYQAYNQARYLGEGAALARQRLDAVREKYLVGEEAAIDTVEALILVQDRTNQYAAARLEAQNALLDLNAFFWGAALQRGNLDSGLAPERFTYTPVEGLEQPDTYRAGVLSANPELILQRVNLRQLEIDRRLAVEALKPVADLKYQVLGMQGKSQFEASQAYFSDNYRYGGVISMPLFLRKERGKLAQIKIKTEQARLVLLQAERDVEIDFDQSYNLYRNLRGQIETQVSMVGNYRRLRDAELIKFSLGESSLFLVNTRESKLLESQTKQAGLEAKWQKARGEILLLSAGLVDGRTVK